MIEYLSGQTLEEVLTEEITLVDYFANWCGPCKMIGMELEELTNTHIIKVDVDTHEELAKTHGVMSIPTIEIYKNKELVKTIIGYKTKDELEQIIKDFK
ncbi:MAG: thioredoxin family protein [Bacilli bacterium]